MSRYRRKPVSVEAHQFLIKDEPWPDGVVNCSACAGCGEPRSGDDAGVPCERCGSGVINLGSFVILTSDGWRRVFDSDWVVREVGGMSFVCGADVFAIIYEPAECLNCYGKGWHPSNALGDYVRIYCDCDHGNELRRKDDAAK